MSATAATPAPVLRPGPYLQVYLGGMRGTAAQKRDKRARLLARCSRLGLPGVVWHHGPRALVAAWDGLAREAADEGLAALASWGLDGTRDSDGTRLTVEEKGALAGDVLARPTCAAGLLDQEGQYDSDEGASDDMDEAGTLRLGDALRAKAPAALVGDQCWWDPLSHGDVRRKPRAIGDGGVFAGFPFDEVAVRAVNWAHFVQLYCNNADTVRSLGERRYPWMRDRSAARWATVQQALERVGLARPLGATVQAYNWVPHHATDALLRYGLGRSLPVICWWEESLHDEAWWQMLALERFLARAGFATAGCDPREAVRAFQREHNRTAHAKITEDGWGGAATAKAAQSHPAWVAP